jgi:transposase
MKVSLWAEIRRLIEVEKLSRRTIAKQLGCSPKTVRRVLGMAHPPSEKPRRARASLLDPHHAKIDALLSKYPQLSGERILEEIRKGPDPYPGQITLVRDYLRKVRPVRRRVYQEVVYEPAQAMQVDWGTCGYVRIGDTRRTVSVFVAVLCHSRLCYLEFCLSQRKAEFYRGVVNALRFFGGSPRQIIFDNLKAAVLNGSGRHACFHPEFLALCGHFYMQPVACQARDPESKGIVEAKVRYIKHNALAGRSDELNSWEDYRRLSRVWRDEVANVRIHQTTRERPVDRFEKERVHLRPWPTLEYDTDEVVPSIVSSHARVEFDGNSYSVPPQVVGKTVTLRANADSVRMIHNGEEIARHQRCYDRRQIVRQVEHQLQALRMRHELRGNDIEAAFDALGDSARKFHLELRRQPLRTSRHLRQLLNLVRLYGRRDVLHAIDQALEFRTFDAAYVEMLVFQERRRRELPSPTQVRPKRAELLQETDLEEPDPAAYDRFCEDSSQDQDAPNE